MAGGKRNTKQPIDYFWASLQVENLSVMFSAAKLHVELADDTTDEQHRAAHMLAAESIAERGARECEELRKALVLASEKGARHG